MVNRMNNRIQRVNCQGSQMMPRKEVGNVSCSKEIKQLFGRLQAVDFALVDTILYLDVYPHCHKAMSYYRELLGEREKLLAKLKEAGAPLNNMSNFADSWRWTDAPWPWELEANI